MLHACNMYDVAHISRLHVFRFPHILICYAYLLLGSHFVRRGKCVWILTSLALRSFPMR